MVRILPDPLPLPSLPSFRGVLGLLCMQWLLLVIAILELNLEHDRQVLEEIKGAPNWQHVTSLCHKATFIIYTKKHLFHGLNVSEGRQLEFKVDRHFDKFQCVDSIVQLSQAQAQAKPSWGWDGTIFTSLFVSVINDFAAQPKPFTIQLLL